MTTDDDDRDLRKFDNVCRLFPLPGVVLFPHAVLPLHIFEPRYRQMTEDALASDRLLTVVRLRPAPAPGSLGDPPIEPVACLGRILRHERLPDGRFNLLLLGRKRVRLAHELPGPSPYRRASATILEDRDGPSPSPRRAELTGLFRAVFRERHELDPDLDALLETELPLGVLTDIMGHALALPPEWKQRLLGNTDVAQRAASLLTMLRRMAPGDPDRGRDPVPFPPPFSVN